MTVPVPVHFMGTWWVTQSSNSTGRKKWEAFFL